MSSCAWCRTMIIAGLTLIGLAVIGSGGSASGATVPTLAAFIIAKTSITTVAAANALALGFLLVVILVLGFSGAMDWFCCNVMSVSDCCPPEETDSFWSSFNAIVEQGGVNEGDCEELTSIVNDLESSGEIAPEQITRMRQIVADLCEEE